MKGQRFADIPDDQSNLTILLQGIVERLFLAVAPLSYQGEYFKQKLLVHR
jgi:hypothetical protein